VDLERVAAPAATKQAAQQRLGSAGIGGGVERPRVRA
jgi:hypothetical protein